MEHSANQARVGPVDGNVGAERWAASPPQVSNQQYPSQYSLHQNFTYAGPIYQDPPSSYPLYQHPPGPSGDQHFGSGYAPYYPYPNQYSSYGITLVPLPYVVAAGDQQRLTALSYPDERTTGQNEDAQLQTSQERHHDGTPDVVPRAHLSAPGITDSLKRKRSNTEYSELPLASRRRSGSTTFGSGVDATDASETGCLGEARQPGAREKRLSEYCPRKRRKSAQEQRIFAFEQENGSLLGDIGLLLKEVAQARNDVQRHALCNCPPIQQYCSWTAHAASLPGGANYGEAARLAATEATRLCKNKAGPVGRAGGEEKALRGPRLPERLSEHAQASFDLQPIDNGPDGVAMLWAQSRQRRDLLHAGPSLGRGTAEFAAASDPLPVSSTSDAERLQKLMHAKERRDSTESHIASSTITSLPRVLPHVGDLSSLQNGFNENLRLHFGFHSSIPAWGTRLSQSTRCRPAHSGESHQTQPQCGGERRTSQLQQDERVFTAEDRSTVPQLLCEDTDLRNDLDQFMSSVSHLPIEERDRELLFEGADFFWTWFLDVERREFVDKPRQSLDQTIRMGLKSGPETLSRTSS